MAVNDFNTEYLTTSHGKIRVDEGHHCDIYFGNKEALIDIGLVQKKWFPGEDGNNKTSVRIIDHGEGCYQVIKGRGVINKEKFKIIRIEKYANKFNVYMPLSDRVKKERDLKHNKMRLERELNELITGEERAKLHLRNLICEGIHILKEASKINLHGYYYSDEFVAGIEAISNEIFHKAVYAEVKFNQEERKRIENEIKHKHLGKTDESFKSFLDTVVDASPEIIDGIKDESDLSS